jgi:hypothetical protein
MLFDKNVFVFGFIDGQHRENHSVRGKSTVAQSDECLKLARRVRQFDLSGQTPGITDAAYPRRMGENAVLDYSTARHVLNLERRAARGV